MCDINNTGEITKYTFRSPTSNQSVRSVIMPNNNQSTQQQPAQTVAVPLFKPIGARLTPSGMYDHQNNWKVNRKRPAAILQENDHAVKI